MTGTPPSPVPGDGLRPLRKRLGIRPARPLCLDCGHDHRCRCGDDEAGTAAVEETICCECDWEDRGEEIFHEYRPPSIARDRV